MRMHRLLAAAATATLLIAGLTSTAAQADRVPPAASSGPMVVWGDAADLAAGPAIAEPDLGSLVVDVAVNDRATAVVTADGQLRVWGQSGASEVDLAPTHITDAVAVTLTNDSGAVVHERGTVTAWGSSTMLIEKARSAYEIDAALALLGDGGYSINNKGTLVSWGSPLFPLPAEAASADSVDVSAGPSQALALQRNGTVVAWGDPQIPEFNTVPDFGGRKATQIATGPGANGVVLEDGTIRIWGPSVPAGQPDLTGKRVISLDLGTNAGVVTDDGTVYTWGPDAAVNAVPASLTGQPVSSIAMGAKHAAVIIGFRKLSETSVSGTLQVGHTLTATPARFSLSQAVVTGQWFANGVPIKGQTGTTLKLDDSLVDSSLTYESTATLAGVTRSSETTRTNPVIRAWSTSTLTVSPGTAAAGKTRKATVKVTRIGGTPTGTVRFTTGDHARIVVVDRGKATWRLPQLPVGKHTITATYSGTPSADPSVATPATIKVTKAASKVRAAAQAAGKKLRVAVAVQTARNVSAKGKVTVTLAGKKATGKVDINGEATLAFPNVRRGQHTATITYSGNRNVSGSKGKVKVRG